MAERRRNITLSGDALGQLERLRKHLAESGMFHPSNAQVVQAAINIALEQVGKTPEVLATERWLGKQPAEEGAGNERV